jgi:large subunit ribosomal protein L6
MSRVAKGAIVIPNGVSILRSGNQLTVKGSKSELSIIVDSRVGINQNSEQLSFSVTDHKAWAIAGTTRALVNNMIIGVSTGFEKKLELVGVGYRAKASGNSLNMTLGYSHPIDYQMPVGVTVETPTQTTIVIKGADKQLIGMVASEIRAMRAPEPYKGKGVRYADEQVHRKEAKKK